MSILCKLFGHKPSKWIHPQGDNEIIKGSRNRKGGNHKQCTFGKWRYEFKYCTRCGETIKERYKFKHKW